MPLPLFHASGISSADQVILNNTTVSDIVQDNEVVGWKYKGESYYMGLPLKTFHHDQLEHITSPHADDIQLHLDSRWSKPFIKQLWPHFHCSSCA